MRITINHGVYTLFCHYGGDLLATGEFTAIAAMRLRDGVYDVVERTNVDIVLRNERGDHYRVGVGQQPITAPVNVTIYCRQCGIANNAGAKVCYYCETRDP
jgi:hypothetical protein